MRCVRLACGVVLALLLGSCGGGGSGPTEQTIGTWKSTSSMMAARGGHSATLLPSGLVLVAGGLNYNGTDSTETTELYDPVAGTWHFADSMMLTRWGHQAVLLPTGVLVVGGDASTGSGAPHSPCTFAYLFDPTSGTWRSVASMNTPRQLPSATVLPSGEVLIAGGITTYTGNMPATNSAELYNPSTDTWSATGSMAVARFGHSAVLLPSGKVLVIGGAQDNANGCCTNVAELYDPGSGTWSSAGALPWSSGAQSATLLLSGKVLVAGGSSDAANDLLDRAALYDPVAGAWKETAPMKRARMWHGAALLPSGKVLVVGGSKFASAWRAEVYDPATETWEYTGPVASEHGMMPAAVRLGDGTILVVGGDVVASPSDSFSGTAAADLFTE